MSLAIVLSMSSILNNIPGRFTGNKRIQQYVEGLKNFKKHVGILSKYNPTVIVMDNTIEGKFPQEITDEIPVDWKTFGFVRNNYGSCNVGCGVIEQWLEIKNELRKYDWIIHHEPRTIFVNSSFFDNIRENGLRGLFGSRNKHFYTGTFCISSLHLLQYIESRNLEQMCINKIGIEYDLYDFMGEFPYDSVEKVGVGWLDYHKTELYMF